MKYKALCNLKNAAAAHAWHCFMTIDSTQACTPQQRDLLAAMDHVHAMACRELQRFALNENVLMLIAEANGILQSAVEGDDCETDPLCEALDVLQKASRRLRGEVEDA